MIILLLIGLVQSTVLKQGDISLHYDLFTPAQQEDLLDLRRALFGGYWKFYDYEHQPTDGVLWQLPIDISLFSQSPLWERITALLPTSDQGQTEHVDGRARVIRRGDNVKISQMCSDNEEGYTTVLFLTKLHNQNDYGEVLFFNQAVDEVIATIQPLQYSILVWPCNLHYQFQYPSISTGFGQVFIQLTHYKKLDVAPVYLSHTIKPFPLIGGGYERDPLYNISQYLRTTHRTSLNRPIHTLQGLFTPQLLESLRNHLYLHSRYYYDDSDDTDQTDNVQWISGHQTSAFVKSRFWSIIEQTVEAVSGHKGWYPYDISCNLNRAWDHTRIHKDCYDKEEYTFLLYLNPDLGPGDLAGTVFYQQTDLDNIVMSTVNRYGSVVLFHCDIQHAGRPPTAYNTVARYSFAVKVARTKLDAVSREMVNTVSALEGYEDEEEAVEWIMKHVQSLERDETKLEQSFDEMSKKKDELHILEFI